MKTPTKVSEMYLECKCCDISETEWNKLMAGATRANKRVINRLIRQHCPGCSELTKYRNPYTYLKTKTHLIPEHSAINYFFRYKI